MSSFWLRSAGVSLSIAVLAACGARSTLDDASTAASAGSGGSASTSSGSAGAPVDAGCHPVPCPQRFDPVTCTCVADACPNDQGEVVVATIAIAAANGTAITIRDGVIYWATEGGTNNAEGMVSRVARCGGDVTTLASNLLEPTALATDGTHVFFGTIGDDNTGLAKGALSVVSANGGAPSVVSPGPIYQGEIATDGRDVYWTGFSPAKVEVGLFKAPVDGGKAKNIVANEVFGPLIVDGSQIFLSQPASVPANSKLLVTTLDGPHLAILVNSSLDYPGILAIDDTNIYYVAGDDEVTRLPKSGGVGTTIAQAEINALAVDEANVYWAQGDATSNVPNGIERVSKSGGDVTEISSSYGSAIAVDDTYVYWLRGGDLVRMPK